MKRKLAIAFLGLAMVTALSTQAISAPSAEKKKVADYGYQVFDLKVQMSIAAADHPMVSNYAGIKILMKSLKARTTYNDTITNAVTKTQYADAGYHPSAVTVQVDLNKISGTAAGKLILEGSVDGINYVRIAKTDSLILTNVTTQRKIFFPDGLDLRFRYFQAKVIPTGTQSVRMNSFLYADQ